MDNFKTTYDWTNSHICFFFVLIWRSSFILKWVLCFFPQELHERESNLMLSSFEEYPEQFKIRQTFVIGLPFDRSKKNYENH